MNDLLVADLHEDEGEVLHAYLDDKGYLTIGVGILIDHRRGGGITREESAYLLSNRIASKTAELNTRLPWALKLDPVRRNGLLNMAFQLGTDGLLGFKNALELVRLGKYMESRAHFEDSDWAKQTPVRAARVIDQIVTGVRTH